MLLDALDEWSQIHHASKADPTAESPEFAEIFESEAAGFNSPFHSALRNALTSVARAPDVSSINQWITDTAPARFVAAEVLVQLLLATLKDTSPDRHRSAALADKTLAFVASVWANPIPQKAVDLARYSVEAGYLPLNRIPFISEWFNLSKHAEESAQDGEENS